MHALLVQFGAHTGNPPTAHMFSNRRRSRSRQRCVSRFARTPRQVSRLAPGGGRGQLARDVMTAVAADATAATTAGRVAWSLAMSLPACRRQCLHPDTPGPTVSASKPCARLSGCMPELNAQGSPVRSVRVDADAGVPPARFSQTLVPNRCHGRAEPSIRPSRIRFWSRVIPARWCGQPVATPCEPCMRATLNVNVNNLLAISI